MVSLEDKKSYIVEVRESSKMRAFHDLITDKSILHTQSESLNETDEIFFGIIGSIQTDNKELFEYFYNKKNKSNPSKESPSPFVNDDFLIFCLIVSILKFNLNTNWIKNIVSIRSRTPITITFENLLDGNFHSKSNLQEIVLMYFQLNNRTLITNNFLTTTFKSISENINLFENKSDFHKLCSIRAYELIIELKESPTGSKIALLTEFNSKFIRRVRMLALVLQTLAFILFLYCFVQLLSKFPSFKVFFEKYDPIFTIMGILGLSVLGNFIPKLKEKSYEVLLRLFGYPMGLIKKLGKKEN